MKLNTLIVFLSIPLLTIAAVNKTEKGKPPPIPTESITNLDSLIMTFPVCIYDCMFDLVLIGAETAPQCKLLTGADDEKPDWKCFCSDDSSKYTAADNRTLEAASEKFAICAEEALEDCSTVELENFEVYFNNLDDYCNKILSGSGDKPPTASRNPSIHVNHFIRKKSPTEEEETKKEDPTKPEDAEKKDKTSDATIVGLTGSYGLTSVVVLGFVGALTFLV